MILYFVTFLDKSSQMYLWFKNFLDRQGIYSLQAYINDEHGCCFVALFL